MTHYIPLLACAAIGIALAYGAYTDYKDRIILNRVPLSILVLGFFTATPMISKFVGLAVMVLTLVLLTVIMKQKSGGGDIKIYCALAFALGLPMLAVVLALSILLAKGTNLIVKRKRLAKGERIPLCTFVAPAYVIAMVLSFCLV